MRVLSLLAGIAGIVLAFAQAAADTDNEKLSAELQGWLNHYAEVYNRQDYAALLALWDKDDPDVIYMAEEINPPLHGWARINAYFNPKPGVQVLDGIRNRYSEVRARLLAPDLAFATYRLDFDIKVKNMKPMSSWDRCMATFRKRGSEWKLVTYGEAPQAPLTMVRKMLENAAPADFNDWMKQQQADKERGPGPAVPVNK
jgi:ketosteroid isomerase-like protein